MSQQNWKFFAPLPSGTTLNTPIVAGDKLEDALYKLQGQRDSLATRAEVLEANVQGSTLVDVTGVVGTLNMTQDDSRHALIIFFDNNNDPGHTVSLYDSINNPTQYLFFNCSTEVISIRMGTSDDVIDLQPSVWTSVAYGYAMSMLIEISGRVNDGDKGDITVSNQGTTYTLNAGVVDKTDVGLGNVDNTSDINKPISTATQTALDAKVDESITINGYGLSSNVTLTKSDLGLSNVDNTSDLNKPISTATQSALDTKENSSNKGAANGYAPLDSNSKVPVSNLPDSIIGSTKFKGTWNANTNVISSSDSALNGNAIPAAASGNEGFYFVVSTDGTTVINGINDWKIGDWIISIGTSWKKIDNTDSVVSVNGFTGAITLTTANIADSTDKKYVTDAEKTKLSNLSGTNSGDQTIILTSDVTGSGTGSFATTIANNAVTNAKAADMATQTIKGRNTFGSGDPEDLTVTAVTAMLDPMVGATGSVGTKGLVPQPPANSQNYLLSGDATFKNIGNIINATPAKSAPIDTDTLIISDIENTYFGKKITWANIKATLKTYFDAIYLALPGGNGIAVRTSGTTSVNRSIQGVTGLTTVTDGDGVSGNPIVSISLENNNVSIATDYTTTSSSYVTLGAPIRLSGLSAGTYLVLATSNVGNNNSNAECWMGIHSGTSGSTTLATGGEMVANPYQGSTSIEVPITCHAVVTITTGQVIEPKWKRSAGTLTVYHTTMHAIRIG